MSPWASQPAPHSLRKGLVSASREAFSKPTDPPQGHRPPRPAPPPPPGPSRAESPPRGHISCTLRMFSITESKEGLPRGQQGGHGPACKGSHSVGPAFPPLGASHPLPCHQAALRPGLRKSGFSQVLVLAPPVTPCPLIALNRHCTTFDGTPNEISR